LPVPQPGNARTTEREYYGMKHHSGKALLTGWLLLVFIVTPCARNADSRTERHLEQPYATGNGTMEPPEDHCITYNDGTVLIGLDDDFTYMITDGFGVVVETGRGSRPRTVGNNLKPGIYSVSVKNTRGLYTESITIR